MIDINIPLFVDMIGKDKELSFRDCKILNSYIFKLSKNNSNLCIERAIPYAAIENANFDIVELTIKDMIEILLELDKGDI